MYGPGPASYSYALVFIAVQRHLLHIYSNIRVDDVCDDIDRFSWSVACDICFDSPVGRKTRCKGWLMRTDRMGLRLIGRQDAQPNSQEMIPVADR